MQKFIEKTGIYIVLIIVLLLIYPVWKLVQKLRTNIEDMTDGFTDVERWAVWLSKIDTKLEFRLHQKKIFEVLSSLSRAELQQLSKEFYTNVREYKHLKLYKNLTIRQYVEMLSGKKYKNKLLSELERGGI